MGGTLVGINLLFHTLGGTLVVYTPLLHTLGGTLVGIYTSVLHPRRHPGGYIPLSSTLEGTLVGISHLSPP